MAKQASIPITDAGSECTASYGVRYRATGSIVWQSTPEQFTTPILINNLVAATEYDYEITRRCCNGLAASAATGTFTTTA